ncbi:hypothetical protein AVEN_99431-1 [Araneus ventricosus]|uniref:Uncharacterized protein n=1 Tax=Araneus ventricosus TaxID=182803 RepID=A0A4Y2MCL9_ARAVE|nr:hypothetical protein AVEN_99431-1 [Araneus ventricosus]
MACPPSQSDKTMSKKYKSWKNKLPLPQGVGLLPVSQRKLFYFPSTTYWNQHRHSSITYLGKSLLGLQALPREQKEICFLMRHSVFFNVHCAQSHEIPPNIEWDLLFPDKVQKLDVSLTQQVVGRTIIGAHILQ